jgi:dienelactone hydrolase
MQYGSRFAQAGLHAFIFDYRHFGQSDGQPRQLISIRRQLEDWQSAVDHARGLDGVDPDRLALFGTSFSGGHVVRTAAEDGHVAAVVSQCPMMDGFAALRNVVGYAGAGQVVRLAQHGLRDVWRMLTGQPPHRIAIVGPPGSLAAMATEDSQAGYRALAPPDFINSVCARIGLTVGLYRPGKWIGLVRCPILIQICEKDSVAPPQAAEAAARRACHRAEVRRYPIGHFDIYQGEHFERALTDQVEFLSRHLSS